MTGINSKNVKRGEAETAEQLLLQKIEDNQGMLQALNTAMEQKRAELDKVQQEIEELKKLHTGDKSL